MNEQVLLMATSLELHFIETRAAGAASVPESTVAATKVYIEVQPPAF